MVLHDAALITVGQTTCNSNLSSKFSEITIVTNGCSTGVMKIRYECTHSCGHRAINLWPVHGLVILSPQIW